MFSFVFDSFGDYIFFKEKKNIITIDNIITATPTSSIILSPFNLYYIVYKIDCIIQFLIGGNNYINRNYSFLYKKIIKIEVYDFL